MSAIAQPYVPFGSGDELPVVKEQFRRAIIAERDKRSPRELERAAHDFAQVVGDLQQVRAARTVAAYAARASEPGTSPLLDRLSRRGTRVLLPVLGTGLQREWAPLTSVEELEIRAPGRPPEPAGPTLGPDALAEADVVVVPALAVDTAGYRLGHGGGWYDRVLEHVRPGVPVIALVFGEEIYDADSQPLPVEPHDRRVHAAVTTTKLRELRDWSEPV
ncbi:5-formyltetrahydrofolate cyclo-ligase [Isoptericola sp. b441]|uniref:5-formyltetrahydrofolate cyclo-ligase n=1 Tax=Actinotalea lenta TaxID=3064654 RepID=A0ABT9D7E8_9CELL|nr:MULTISPECIES: 5-formyltetrahydrofolate cyclo-ligase [unclassified Isoptericola]MDO8106770.1 5-formyltetrahydrofolate cyclo-ligase [Isoptericola sp. b441]MDO8121518.1 5-formyltetrahydrofolate cyclo-ligase [Isoptericola sp. b490]